MIEAKFAIGHLVTHALYGYTGIIIDADPEFSLSEEWYQKMAQTQPSKQQPWYHILVHNSDIRTYVPEHSLIKQHNSFDLYRPELNQALHVTANTQHHAILFN